jgi:hypothetical protein
MRKEITSGIGLLTLGFLEWVRPMSDLARTWCDKIDIHVMAYTLIMLTLFTWSTLSRCLDTHSTKLKSNMIYQWMFFKRGLMLTTTKINLYGIVRLIYICIIPWKPPRGVWQGVLGHHPCLLIHNFNFLNTFYRTLYPSDGELRVSFSWNFDFIVLTNSTRQKRVLEGTCSAKDLAYFIASFGPRNLVRRQYYVFHVA